MVSRHAVRAMASSGGGKRGSTSSARLAYSHAASRITGNVKPRARTKILVIAKSVLFPVFLNTLQGSRNVEKNYIELADILIDAKTRPVSQSIKWRAIRSQPSHDLI